MALKLPAENANLLSRFFEIEEERVALFKILTGKKVEDEALAQKVSEGFVMRSLAEADKAQPILDDKGVEFPVGSKSELISVSAMMLGVNEKGQSLVSNKTVQKELLEKIFMAGLAERGQFKLVNSQVAHALIAYAASPDEVSYSEEVKEAMSDFLTDDRLKGLLLKVASERLSNPVSDEKIKPLLERFDIPVFNSVTPEEIERAAALTPSDSTEGVKLTDEVLENDIITLSQNADNAYAKKKLDMDLQTDAQLRINAIMDDNPDFVHRSLINKLVDRVKQGTLDAFDNNHLIYPKESIFSQSVSQVDTNGRVVKELFQFTEDSLFRSASVKFKDPQPSDDALKLAALHTLKSGISHPYVRSKFRDPQLAISFMTRTVDALVEAGYDIETISVDPALRKAFEHHVATYHSHELSITEAPEELRFDPESPEIDEETKIKPIKDPRDKLPIEIVNEYRDDINLEGEKIAKALDPNAETQQSLKDLDPGQLRVAMSLAALVDEASDDWSVNLKDVQLAPSLIETFKGVKRDLSRILDRADPTNDVKNTSGAPEKKILEENEDLFRAVFKDDPRILNVYGEESPEQELDNGAQNNQPSNDQSLSTQPSALANKAEQSMEEFKQYKSFPPESRDESELDRLAFIAAKDRLEASREAYGLDPSDHNERQVFNHIHGLNIQTIKQMESGNVHNFDLGDTPLEQLKLGVHKSNIEKQSNVIANIERAYDGENYIDGSTYASMEQEKEDAIASIEKSKAIVEAIEPGTYPDSKVVAEDAGQEAPSAKTQRSEDEMPTSDSDQDNANKGGVDSVDVDQDWNMGDSEPPPPPSELPPLDSYDDMPPVDDSYDDNMPPFEIQDDESSNVVKNDNVPEAKDEPDFPIALDNPHLKEIAEKGWSELSPEAVEFIVKLDGEGLAMINNGLPQEYGLDPDEVRATIFCINDVLSDITYSDFATEASDLEKAFVSSLPNDLVPKSILESIDKAKENANAQEQDQQNSQELDDDRPASPRR